MASPQKEHGFTPIANELLRQVIRTNLRASQLRIWLCLAIDSYGKSRKETTLSIGDISKMTAIKRASVARELKTLLVSRLILAGGSLPGETSGKIVRKINKDYDTWVVSTLGLGLHLETRPSLHLGTSTNKAVTKKEKKQIPPTPYSELVKTYNELRGKMSACNEPISEKRQKLLASRWRQNPVIEFWATVISRLATSGWATGDNPRGWRADIDFVFREGKAQEILEGKYDSRQTTNGLGATVTPGKYAHISD